MENKSIERLEKALDFLMGRLSENVEVIKNNSSIAKEIISEDPFTKDLEGIRSENKNILEENKELLSLQVGIRRYLSLYGEKIKNENTEVLKSEKTFEEWFVLTSNGDIDLNENHPMAGNIDFLNDLMSFYKDHELYEKCNAVLQVMNSLHKTIS